MAFALVFGLESYARGADFDLVMGNAGFARRDLQASSSYIPAQFAFDQKEITITADALLQTIDISAEIHLAGACFFTIGVEGAGEIFRRIFLDDDLRDVISGNAENVLFNPGVPIAAGDLLILKLTNMTSSHDCKYTILLNYIFVP